MAQTTHQPRFEWWERKTLPPDDSSYGHLVKRWSKRNAKVTMVTVTHAAVNSYPICFLIVGTHPSCFFLCL